MNEQEERRLTRAFLRVFRDNQSKRQGHPSCRNECCVSDAQDAIKRVLSDLNLRIERKAEPLMAESDREASEKDRPRVAVDSSAPSDTGSSELNRRPTYTDWEAEDCSTQRPRC